MTAISSCPFCRAAPMGVGLEIQVGRKLRKFPACIICGYPLPTLMSQRLGGRRIEMYLTTSGRIDFVLGETHEQEFERRLSEMRAGQGRQFRNQPSSLFGGIR